MQIQLPDFVFAELYKDNLVVIPTKNTAENQAKDREINTTETDNRLPKKKFWLGENNRQIIVVLDDDKNVFADDNALQFLTNILSACKFNLSDVAIVNVAHTRLNYEKIVEELSGKYVLLFGINKARISLEENIHLFENKIIRQVQVISAPALENLMKPTPEAKSDKGKLWSCLKKMFGL